MKVNPYKPDPFERQLFGGPRTITEVLGMLAGAASTCWEGGTGDSLFQSELASQFVDQADQIIKDMILNEVATMLTTLKIEIPNRT